MPAGKQTTSKRINTFPVRPMANGQTQAHRHRTPGWGGTVSEELGEPAEASCEQGSEGDSLWDRH